uniref:PE family protein n=1 Tax=Mycobacterium sp. Marseille-P9652 TaxID=2654950 RepID=UPI0012E811C0
MSFMFVDTDVVSGAAGDLARIGSVMNEVSSAAAAQTTAVVAPAADQVSAIVAALFGAHGQEFQAVSAEVAQFHDQFVQTLLGGAQAYSATEAANAGPLQPVLDLINEPTRILVGRPLIGDGNAGTAPGQAGEGGGILFGNGGAGGPGAPGGSALFFGSGGPGGDGLPGGTGGAGGNGGIFWGTGGTGGAPED